VTGGDGSRQHPANIPTQATMESTSFSVCNNGVQISPGSCASCALPICVAALLQEPWPPLVGGVGLRACSLQLTSCGATAPPTTLAGFRVPGYV
jgi:hypothetical protein